MIEKIRNKPVAFSILFAIALTVIWGITSLFVQEMFGQYELQALQIATLIVNIIFAIIAIVLLGMINQINGFKHVFKVKGLARGLLVLVPVMVFFIFNLAFNAGNMTNIDLENIGIFAPIALMQAASAFMVNVLFRGLLVTALFIKLSGTKGQRVKSVFKASALYLVMYIPLSILNTGSIEFMQLVNTFIVSAGFCAAYLYSKNLISLILVQGIWQILGAAIDFFGFGDYAQITPLAFIVLIAILISIVVFAVIFSRRAEPFENIEIVTTTTGGE